jgi:hypothetical protein
VRSADDDDFDDSDVRFDAGGANAQLEQVEVDRILELLVLLERRAVKLELDLDNVRTLIRQTKLSARRARK